jgi:hypothetical protein
MSRRVVAVAGVVLVAAAIGGFFWLRASTAGPSTAVDRALVTGYATSTFFAETGPVSVELRGASAARIEQIVEGLPPANMENICAENSEIYQIAFTVGTDARQNFELVGYACGSMVVKTPSPGSNGNLIDRNCALLAAVRRVLPAGATATDAEPCGPADPELIAGTSS